MYDHDYPTNDDRAHWGREAIAWLVGFTRFNPGDRDLDSREVLLEAGRDLVSYVFHTVAQTDIDMEAFAASCLESWTEDVRDETAEDLGPVATETRVRTLLPGAAGPSLYPQPRRETWWTLLTGNRGIRFDHWPIGVKRRIVAGLVRAEAHAMRAALAAAANGRPVPEWDPEIALVSVELGEEAHWAHQRLGPLLESAHRSALEHYSDTEAEAVAAHLADLFDNARRKGVELVFDAHTEPEGNSASFRQHTGHQPTIFISVGRAVPWRYKDGRVCLERPLTGGDADLLVRVIGAVAPTASSRWVRPAPEPTGD